MPLRVSAAITAGSLYYAVVFAFAFVMGVLRVMAIAPRIGETAAVFIEIPVVLLVSWFVARRMLRGRGLATADLDAVGAVAFTLTMMTEALLAVLMFGQTLVHWALQLATPIGLLGLAGQIAFAVLPILASQQRRPKSEVE